MRPCRGSPSAVMELEAQLTAVRLDAYTNDAILQARATIYAALIAWYESNKNETVPDDDELVRQARGITDMLAGSTTVETLTCQLEAQKAKTRQLANAVYQWAQAVHTSKDALLPLRTILDDALTGCA